MNIFGKRIKRNIPLLFHPKIKNGTFGLARQKSQSLAKPKEPLFSQP